jgi:glycine dehydrogenase
MQRALRQLGQCRGARSLGVQPRLASLAQSHSQELRHQQKRCNHAGSPFEDQKRSLLAPLDTFARRHIGPATSSIDEMVKTLDPPAKSLDEFVHQVIPQDILSDRHLKVAGPIEEHGSSKGSASQFEGFTETQLLGRLRQIASKNKVYRSYIGCGYAGTKVPEVIKRNVLEGPGWYTAYTPYQPEISQGRLESLLNYQTVVTDLTGLAISNASLLDEATSAAEAMTLSMNVLPTSRQKRANKTFFVSHLCHPQTIAVLASRAEGFGIKLVVGDILKDDCKAVKEIGQDLIGALAQYPDTEGNVEDFRGLGKAIHDVKATFCVATDLLALTMLTPPGEFGADIAFGNAQRFGVPLGFGGPHAAFIACRDKHKRRIPGRLVGVSKEVRRPRFPSSTTNS